MAFRPNEHAWLKRMHDTLARSSWSRKQRQIMMRMPARRLLFETVGIACACSCPVGAASAGVRRAPTSFESRKSGKWFGQLQHPRLHHQNLTVPMMHQEAGVDSNRSAEALVPRSSKQTAALSTVVDSAARNCTAQKMFAAGLCAPPGPSARLTAFRHASTYLSDHTALLALIFLSAHLITRQPDKGKAKQAQLLATEC